jgi:hypothetical protein
MPTLNYRARPRAGLPALALTAALLAMVLVLLAAAGSAEAAPTFVTEVNPRASDEPLALAGPATLVAGFEGEKADLVRSFAPGRPPVVIARVHPKGEGSGRIDLVGSTSRIGLLEKGVTSGYKDCCATYYRSVATAALGGPVTALTAGCFLAPTLDETADPEGGILANSAVALDGEVLAYDSYGCLVIHDYASGLQRIVPLQATLDPVDQGTIADLAAGALLRVAGRLVAYRANQPGGEGPASVAVYDIDTGSELYRVPLPPEGSSEPAPTFALQSDGTLVIAGGASCTATVSTVAHPAPVPLGVAACEVDGLHNGQALIVTPGPGDHQALAWTPIKGAMIHPIADLGVHGTLQSITPVMDETDVAYALNSCWMPTVYRTTLTEPGIPPAPPASCPVIVSPHHATLTSRALRVRVSCPLGCRGELEAHAGTMNELRQAEHGRNVITQGLPNISVAPGHSATITLVPEEQEDPRPLTRALTRMLRRRHGLDLRLDFYVQTPSAEGAISPHNAEELGVLYGTRSHVVVPIKLQGLPSRPFISSRKLS